VKRSYSVAIKVGISVALVGYLIFKHGSSELYLQFKGIAGEWLALALGCMLISNVLGAVQWTLILKNLDIHLPFRSALSFYFTGLFFNNFMLGFIGGDFVRIYDIAKTSGKNSEAISTVFLDRLIGLFTLTLFAVIAAFFTLELIRSNFLIVLTVSVLSIICFVLVFLYSKPFAKKFETFGRKVLPDRFHKKIREIYNSLNYYGAHPRLLRKLFLISVCVQTLRIFVHYCTARSVDVAIGLEFFFIFIPVIALLVTIPVTVGGIGLRESSGAMLFQYAGVPGPTTVVFEIMAFTVAIICSLPGGIAFIFRKHESKKVEK